MVVDPIRMCEVLVGLEDVNVDGVDRGSGSGRLTVRVSSRVAPPACEDCGCVRRLKDRADVSLVDLPAFRRPARLLWTKRRWKGCCGTGSVTETDDRIASPKQKLTTRAGRWATVQVGLHRRSVSSVASELGADWHTINNTVVAFGEALVEADTGRVGPVESLGVVDVLFGRFGKFRRRSWATTIVDVDSGQLIDVVNARTAKRVIAWLDTQPARWLVGIRFGVLDLSGPYRKVFNESLPDVAQIADPFHVVKNANQRLDECRRRVQNEQLGHRGHKHDPLYGIRRLLTMAAERLDVRAESRLVSRLEEGDPHGEVQWAPEAKEAVPDLYRIADHADAVETIDELADLMADQAFPAEVNRLGRMLRTWRTKITNWHQHRVSNGPTEGTNNMVKLAKRIGFGFRNFRNFRIRALLYAGKPNWTLLNTLLPAQIR